MSIWIRSDYPPNRKALELKSIETIGDLKKNAANKLGISLTDYVVTIAPHLADVVELSDCKDDQSLKEFALSPGDSLVFSATTLNPTRPKPFERFLIPKIDFSGLKPDEVIETLDKNVKPNVRKQLWTRFERETKESLAAPNFGKISKQLLKSIVTNDRLNIREYDLFLALLRWGRVKLGKGDVSISSSEIPPSFVIKIAGEDSGGWQSEGTWTFDKSGTFSGTQNYFYGGSSSGSLCTLKDANWSRETGAASWTLPYEGTDYSYTGTINWKDLTFTGTWNTSNTFNYRIEVISAEETVSALKGVSADEYKSVIGDLLPHIRFATMKTKELQQVLGMGLLDGTLAVQMMAYSAQKDAGMDPELPVALKSCNLKTRSGLAEEKETKTKTRPNLTGSWGSWQIVQTNENLILTEPSRLQASGYFIDDTHISVTFPDDSTYTAEISSDGNKLSWNNSTSWTRS